jgi:hypothetical protein
VVHNVDNGPCWKFTGFYGNPDVGKHHESWSLLRHLSSLSPTMWVCMNDFNEITEASEKYGMVRRPRWQMMVLAGNSQGSMVTRMQENIMNCGAS